ncbi:ribonuclease HII [Mycoplasma hafezii]|uniref:ribonuclease HII n=1 Tax=Mycoplasma hafezii TaxID=525886 RepID=UPI003CFB2B5E
MDIHNIEKEWKNSKILGLDEAGRGAWAGPIVVAGCVLKPDVSESNLKLIDDSKKFPEAKREKLYDLITQELALEYFVAFIDNETVDQIGPKKASVLGMEQCFNEISKNIKIDVVITDFEKISVPCENIYSFAKADEISKNVAAASIIAKVQRDRYMRQLSQEFPQYHFDEHKGYGTKKHSEALQQCGVTNLHRKSYKPIQNIIKGGVK